MRNQVNFLLAQATQFLQNNNLVSADLLLRQVLKASTNNSEALRLQAIILMQQGDPEGALLQIERAILADKKNGNAHSNKGNIQLSLNKPLDAIKSYKVAISLAPRNSEAHNNLGNAYQEISEYEEAVKCYLRALTITPNNYEFLCNLGNVYWKLGFLDRARAHYESAIAISPSHYESIYNLAHLDLTDFNFERGWMRYESRWLTRGDDRSTPLLTTRPIWDGGKRDGSLFIWAEQGVGDQILYASMFHELEAYPQKIIISVDKKLIPVFKRSFPSFDIIDRDSKILEEDYDEHLPMGSLGYFFRSKLEDFNQKIPYLNASKDMGESYVAKNRLGTNLLCGISWKSGRAKLGVKKSLPLIKLAPIISIDKIRFINLQYGSVDEEISSIQDDLGIAIENLSKIDLFDDIEGALSFISLCDIVLTTSNVTAHLAGALGKETLLLAPLGHGKFWYWSDLNGKSLWYPTVKIFKQERPGDWLKPIEAIKVYLESRVGS